MSAAKINSGRQFWLGFWVVIAVLLTVYVYVNIVASRQVGRFTVDRSGQVLVSAEAAQEWQKIVTQLQGLRRAALDDRARSEVKADLVKRVDTAFSPVYDQIPKFLDFHYSVVGEYTELLAYFGGKGGEELQKILFTQVGFDERLQSATRGTMTDITRRLQQAFSAIEAELGKSGLTEAEVKLLAGALALTVKDIEVRFSNQMLFVRGVGAAAGAVVASKIALKAGTKIAAKATVKAGTKAAAKAAAAAAGGVTVCAWTGPWAFLCGAVAGTAAWFGMDWALIKADEAANRTQFEADLRELVDEQKRDVKAALAANIDKLIDAVSADLSRRLDNTLTSTSPAEAIGGR